MRVVILVIGSVGVYSSCCVRMDWVLRCEELSGRKGEQREALFVPAAESSFRFPRILSDALLSPKHRAPLAHSVQPQPVTTAQLSPARSTAQQLENTNRFIRSCNFFHLRIRTHLELQSPCIAVHRSTVQQCMFLTHSASCDWDSLQRTKWSAQEPCGRKRQRTCNHTHLTLVLMALVGLLAGGTVCRKLRREESR